MVPTKIAIVSNFTNAQLLSNTLCENESRPVKTFVPTTGMLRLLGILLLKPEAMKE